MAKYTIGISTIKLGNVAVDGGPGTSLATLGYTYEDSCKLNQDDPEVTSFFAEEVEDAVYKKEKKGAITLTFQIMNPDTATLIALFGGTATGSSPAKTWNMPDTTPTIEQTVEITPQDGMKMVIPRGSVSAKLNGEFSRKQLFLIDVTITALKPTKTGVGPIQFIE